jgi:hypothetical protein
MLSPYAKQGALSNFVDLNTAQTIDGIKTYTSDLVVNGIKIGRGTGNNSQNTAIGSSALGSGTGSRNTAIGYGAMQSYKGTSFDNNTSVGYSNLVSLTTGNANTSVGAQAMMSVSTGTHNTGIGQQSLLSTTGNYNTALGSAAGGSVTSGSQNTFIGANSNVSTATLTNATAIGYAATVDASNKIQLGNASVTEVNTSAEITAKSFKKSGGTASQYLMADGSVTTGAAIPKTFEALGITLSASYSGTIIYSQNAANPFFPENLPDGFNCVLINYSNFTFTSNTLSTAKFYTKNTGNAGANTFSMPSEGTVRINVVSINGNKRYYISGDIN